MFVPLYDHNPLQRIPRPYVNWTLVAAITVLWAAFQAGDGTGALASAHDYGLRPVLLFDGGSDGGLPEWARLVTYAFVHADFVHLFGNMAFLVVFGDNVEDATGHLRYLAFFVLAAAASGLTYALSAADSAVPLVGASGVVAAVIAAYLILHPRVTVWVLVLWRIPLRLSAVWPIAVWIGFQIVQIATAGESDIAWWAHVGGLAAGALLIVILKRPEVPLFDRPRT
jgi:membrane associated rhomboid family serine protease